MHYRLDGPSSAPVVVLLNSLGTTIELWDAQLPALRQRFRVLRYDQRGHGRSSVPPGPYAFEDLGGDLVELLDRLELDRVSLCGLSLGGMLGMWAAVHVPERIDRLVLCCTSAKLGTPESWRERAATVRSEGVAAVADAALERWFTPSCRPEVVARFREMLVATPREGYAGCCEAIAGLDVRERLGSVVAPTLVLAGAEDPATPPEHAELIASLIPGARVVVLPRAAHLANVEQPEAFNSAVLDHLKEAA